jgi:2-polyprenyl-3-methyl-5-hydroxy-6-metoxy-1,4-benzoquinol methylase
MLVNNQDNLINHPDQVKWNKKYSKMIDIKFPTHPILSVLKDLSLPTAPILELACGLSGNVLSLASLGYNVLAVDISEVALNLLESTIKKNHLESKVSLLLADLTNWQPPKETFSLVLALRYWDKKSFSNACQSVIKGGFIAWETFNKHHLCYHPHFHAEWCLDSNEPANLLTSDFKILNEQDFDNGHTATRRLIAQRKTVFN